VSIVRGECARLALHMHGDRTHLLIQQTDRAAGATLDVSNGTTTPSDLSKLVEPAQNHWRQLNCSAMLWEVIAGVVFKVGTNLAA
jgi:hypothetical protein